MARIFLIVVGVLFVGIALASAEPPATKPADSTVPEQQLTGQINEMEQTLRGLPPSSPDRAKLALDLMRLKQSQRAKHAEQNPPSTLPSLPAVAQSRDQESSKVATTQPADRATDSEIQDWRKEKLDAISRLLERERKGLERDSADPARKQQTVIAIRQHTKRQNEIANMSNDQIAQEIARVRQINETARLKQAQQAAETAELDKTTVSVEETCKSCNGTGKISPERLRAMAAQTVGTGMSGTISNRCPACDGLGHTYKRIPRSDLPSSAQRPGGELLQDKPADGTDKGKQEPKHLRCPLCGGLGSYGSTGTGAIEKYEIGGHVPLHTCEKCAGKGWISADQ